MPPPRLLLAAVLLGLSTARARAQDSAVFTASDFPRLAEGVKLAKAGDVTIKVWSPAGQSWTLESSDNILTLKPGERGGDSAPTWATIGTAHLSSDKPLVVKVVGASFDPDEIVGNYQKQTQTRNAGPAKVAVPAVLSISPDSAFTPDLDTIRGDVDGAGPVSDARRTHVRTNHEGANFHAPADVAAWEARAIALRNHLRVTLGLTPTFPKTPLNAQVFGKVERDGYSIEKVVLETMPGVYLAGNLYRPAGNCRRVPTVLCPHGHWEDGRVNTEVQPRCIRLAKLGCVVFLYDMVGYNDSKPFGHAFLNDRLDAWGFSLPTLQTWNSIRAVDWLTTLPDVDPARIACTGESGGGTQTFLLSALDPRIAVSAPVVMVSERFQGGCVCENASGLRVGTDNVEIAALAAPRPMKLVGATGDWTSNTTTKVHPAIRGVYELIGAPSEVEAALFNFPHNYNETSRNAVYAFLGREILGIEDASQTREGTQTLETPEDLRAFSTDHPAPANVKTPKNVEDDLIAQRAKALKGLSPGDDASTWEAARRALATIHRERVGIEPVPVSQLRARRVRAAEKGDVSLAHWIVERADRGEAVPVVRLNPAKPSGRVAVVVHDRGKAGLFTGRGEMIPLVRALLDRGIGVIGFDPLLVGESFDPAHPAARRPKTAHFTTYNPTLAIDRMRDLATVAAWAMTQEDVREMSLVGLDGGAPLALLARPLIPRVARAFVDLEGFDYGDGAVAVREPLRVPGVLQFGGLGASAALAAPMPLWISRAGTTFEAEWPSGAYRLADTTSALRVSAEAPKVEEVARWIDTGE